jgi:hypothetical protein
MGSNGRTSCLFILLSGATTLLWAISSFGAEPSGGKTSAASAVAARSKSTQVAQPSAKPVAARAAKNSLPKPASDANSTGQPADEPDSNSFLDDHLKSRLWQSRILLPDSNEDAKARSDLQELIQRLNAVTAEQPVNRPVPTKPVAEKTSVGPKNTEPEQPVGADQQGLLNSQTPSGGDAALSPTLMEKLNRLVQDPNQVRNPLEMADLLFLNNRTTEAAIFYAKALALTTPNDPATSDDRAWILFQWATCVRQTDTTKARDLYSKLVVEFPNSPWTELAKANGRLVMWYQHARPEQIIAPPNP